MWLKLVTFAISEFSVTPITFYHLQSSYFTFATYISNLSHRNSSLSRDGGKPTYYWYPSFTCAMALIVITRQRFSAYWLKSKQWNKLAVLFHWSKCLVLDAGTVLISIPLLTCAGFVYCHCAGRWAVLDNTNGKDRDAFRWGLLYSHYHGPYFY